MRLSVGQALDLGSVEVGVDIGALVPSLSIVRQDTSARPESVMERCEVLCGFSLEVVLTVWIGVRVMPVSWDLGPLRMTLVPSGCSVSAWKSQMRRVSCRYVAGVSRMLTVFPDIGFSSVLLQIRGIVEGSRNGLEPRLFKDLVLFSRAMVHGGFVFGPLWVSDGMGEGAAANVA